MMELLALLFICLITGILLYLGSAFCCPDWIDVIEFAVITALFPLGIHCFIFVPALAAAVILTAVNIFIYNKSPGTKNLLRAISVPVIIVSIALLALFAAACVSC